MFAHVIHSDWSKAAKRRWMASARRRADGRWDASGPRPVPADAVFVEDLVARAKEGPTLAAFDLPIGLPVRFGMETGFAGFRELLDALGRGDWPEFFDVAVDPADVGPRRPFYPQKPGAAKLRHLLDGHGVDRIEDLMRACERPGAESGSAGCMFWTLGAKQVGKAALHAWREVIIPVRWRGARLWPFDGDLAGLSAGGLVLAESYPGDAYGQLGLSFRGKSKGRMGDRACFAEQLLSGAARDSIVIDDDFRAAIRSGFPPEHGEDDGFDAAIGLLAAVAVVQGRREAGPTCTEAMRHWEGWILGKRGLPAGGAPPIG